MMTTCYVKCQGKSSLWIFFTYGGPLTELLMFLCIISAVYQLLRTYNVNISASNRFGLYSKKTYTVCHSWMSFKLYSDRLSNQSAMSHANFARRLRSKFKSLWMKKSHRRRQTQRWNTNSNLFRWIWIFSQLRWLMKLLYPSCELRMKWKLLKSLSILFSNKEFVRNYIEEQSKFSGMKAIRSNQQ